MTWTEGCLRISDTIAIHGGYWGIISFGICVIVIILYLLFVGAVGAMIGDTIKELNEKSKNNKK